MKAHCRSARWLGAALLGLSGCWTTSSQLKPQRPPEEYVLPPADDRRFSDYPSFPKGTMNNDRIKLEQERAPSPTPGVPQGPSRPGSRPPGGGY